MVWGNNDHLTYMWWENGSDFNKKEKEYFLPRVKRSNKKWSPCTNAQKSGKCVPDGELRCCWRWWRDLGAGRWRRRRQDQTTSNSHQNTPNPETNLIPRGTRWGKRWERCVWNFPPSQIKKKKKNSGISDLDTVRPILYKLRRTIFLRHFWLSFCEV